MPGRNCRSIAAICRWSCSARSANGSGPSGCVCTGHHLASAEQLPDHRARARFIRRKTGEPVAAETADLVIAADGIHSTMRAKFYPHEGPPKWNGMLLWRATTKDAPILSGR